jgi:hypothetical protein
LLGLGLAVWLIRYRRFWAWISLDPYYVSPRVTSKPSPQPSSKTYVAPNPEHR